MSTQGKREEIVAFMGSYYEEYKVAPTIRLICEKVGVSRKELYKAFPGGLVEICEASGIPIPQKRIERTRKATKATTTRKWAEGLMDHLQLLLTNALEQVRDLNFGVAKMNLESASKTLEELEYALKRLKKVVEKA